MQYENHATNRTTTVLSIAAGAALVAAGIGMAAPAQAEDFYAGQTLTVMIGSKPGGGTDTTGRLVGRFIGDHIPGKPEVLIRNKPLQLIAANDLQFKVRPDGLTVGVFAGGGSVGPVVRGSNAVRYDLREWNYVGSIERGASVQLIRKSALDRLRDPKANPVAHGSATTDRTQDAVAAFGAIYLGWNLKFVLGYPGSNQIYLAYGRGEVDMFGSGTDKILDRFINQEDAVALVTEEAREDYPGVPVFEDILREKGNMKQQDWAAFHQWTGGSSIDKYFALPPKTPEDRVKTLQTAFNATVKDPEFKKAANNILGGGYVPLTAEKTRNIIVNAIDADPAGAEVIKSMRAKLGLPQMKVEEPDLVKVKLDDVKREGRVLVFMNEGEKTEVKVSGSRSEVTIGGKIQPRSAVKTGMNCEVSWVKKGKALEARKIVCP